MIRELFYDVDIIKQAIYMTHDEYGVHGLVNKLLNAIHNETLFISIMEEMFLERLSKDMIDVHFHSFKNQSSEYQREVLEIFVSNYFDMGYLGYDICINTIQELL